YTAEHSFKDDLDKALKIVSSVEIDLEGVKEKFDELLNEVQNDVKSLLN
ncbi:hypothetical protein OGATHE_003065, partial [Ogataea polymorpha]